MLPRGNRNLPTGTSEFVETPLNSLLRYSRPKWNRRKNEIINYEDSA
jgi:hypothetical protein